MSVRKIVFKEQFLWVNTAHVTHSVYLGRNRNNRGGCAEVRFYFTGGQEITFRAPDSTTNSEIESLIAAMFGEDEKDVNF